VISEVMASFVSFLFASPRQTLFFYKVAPLTGSATQMLLQTGESFWLEYAKDYFR